MTRLAYPGGCHCGAIGFSYETSIPPRQWSVRACQCRFCRVHAALSTSDPDGKIVFSAAAPDALQTYRFALRTADFLLCRRCGAYIGAVIEAPGGAFGIINTRTLLDPPRDMAAVTPVHYDSEDSSGRIRRREQRWTPVTSSPQEDR